ncbi:PAS-domain containing protein [Paracoccus sp. (in: a-proteobacteria)]|uniref:PAS-domain containing protein n=1 Tax=Paracoccus sp. TaxID=267 RepID=UPI003A84C59B
MSFQGLWVAGLALVAGTLSVILAIWLIRFWDRWRGDYRPRSMRNLLDHGPKPLVFLFRDDALIDATGTARGLLDHIGAPQDCSWQRLRAWLGPRFPDIAARWTELDRQGRIELTGNSGTGTARLRLVAEDLGKGLRRVLLTDPEREHSGIIVDSMSLLAMEEELDLLRQSLDQTPMLVWRQDADDRISWANAAYFRLAESQGEGDLGWPLPRLLEHPKPVPGAGTSTRRAPLDNNGMVSWYDCHSHRVGDQTMMFALPADAAVRAERSLREFVQTLTKTFADLPIGLAIFDRERKLQLFNPALIDLTGLPTGFLTARPSLFDFLDQLREQRMVPEPKDYRSWRQQISNLESAAATGHHSETWSLPGGRTYRVTGRPHPDGAVAFLFDDITSEVTLTRKFRADLLLGNTVIDGLEDALAVFAPTGKLVLANSAYRKLWGDCGTTLTEAIAGWERQIDAGPGFNALRDRLKGGDQARDSGAISGPEGQLLGWNIARVSGAHQMLRFHAPASALPPIGPDQTPELATAVGAE